MKKIVLNALLFLTLSGLFTSCYTYTQSIGNGAQSGVEIKKNNHYLIWGLAPVGVSNPVDMAAGTEDYDVTVKHTFVDGLIGAITFGIYTPTTTVVTK
jgi:hypothetical protein